jgi:hypothetical protein
VRRALIVLAALVAASLCASGKAQAGACGLPDSNPIWVDFVDGTVPFRSEFAVPGELVATSGMLPGSFDASGGNAVFWQMHLEHYVGTPSAPAALDGIQSAADEQIDQAVNSVGCGQTIVALNEMAGVTAAGPLSPTAALYRQDVLAFVQDLAALGAQPYLLLPSTPNATADPTYWAQLAASAHLVREVYPSAPTVMAGGPVLASHALRVDYRTAVQKLVALGVPASQVGVILGFQSGGVDGRDGLQPLAEWLEYVKLATLAANEVAGEQAIGSVWTWGWGLYSTTGADPDKATAACVELWTRNPALCNAPALASFDTDLTEGQLSLVPANAQCVVGVTPILETQLAAATTLLGNPQAALTALFERVAATPLVPVTHAEERAAEKQLFATETQSRLLATARTAGVSIGFLRGVIVDQLRYAQLSRAQLLAAEQQALASTVCRDDVLPSVGDVRLASKLPQLMTLSD